MRIRALVAVGVVVLSVACGVDPSAPACIENEVSCSAHCAFGCFDGAWEPLRCKVCGDTTSAVFSGAAFSSCTIAPPAASECVEAPTE